MITKQLADTILREIDILESDYRSNQGMILTEDDLKCNLFARLKNILPEQSPTFNPGVNGSMLHSEVKFFDEHGKLSLIPDLTIIDTRFLSIYHSIELSIDHNRFEGFKRYSSKNFEIGGNAIIIELKFCRSQDGIKEGDIKSFERDIKKIKRLQKLVYERSAGNDCLFGIFAVFNKTNACCDGLNTLIAKYDGVPDLHIVSKTGNVDFSNVSVHRGGLLTDTVAYC
ncbi:MAG: hypothetical protein EOP56_02620 [Sphingobacteriales bacterium]|nr:MAG: hypothetical protein EOP56_02620 [Sphingobacteriales bacterium]